MRLKPHPDAGHAVDVFVSASDRLSGHVQTDSAVQIVRGLGDEETRVPATADDDIVDIDVVDLLGHDAYMCVKIDIVNCDLLARQLCFCS